MSGQPRAVKYFPEALRSVWSTILATGSVIVGRGCTLVLRAWYGQDHELDVISSLSGSGNSGSRAVWSFIGGNMEGLLRMLLPPLTISADLIQHGKTPAFIRKRVSITCIRRSSRVCMGFLSECRDEYLS